MHVQNKHVCCNIFPISSSYTSVIFNFSSQIIFLSCISTLAFVSPIELGDKTGLCIQNLLTYAVYVSIVADYLPDTSLQVNRLA